MNKIRAFMLRATVGVFAAGALAAGVMTAPTAGAQSPQDGGRQAFAAQTPFAAQTQRAGLTPAQAGELQDRVDGYLAEEPGSRQVSANRIATEGGDLVVAAPGQRYARDLAGAGASGRAPAACAYGHLCLYRPGDSRDYYRCGTYSLPWVGDGTFNNNQTRGTTARFLNSDRSVRWTSRAPQTGTATWTGVYYVVPC
ncbi:hypothetical protein ACFRMN_29235 [Streptomyces sp. NPDC056835]|uniref:hypothetical protein n=1 Tax=Streptomyces sp. NPDC056835 TaxID=3345956 RepID=UPI0036898E24